MNKKLYHRFELYKNGEPQGVGVFQGLREVVDYSTNMRLCKYINNWLPVPRILDIKSMYDIEDTVSYFTQEGLNKFIYHLTEICRYVERKSNIYEIRKTIAAFDPTEDFLYSDEYQILIDSKRRSKKELLELQNKKNETRISKYDKVLL